MVRSFSANTSLLMLPCCCTKQHAHTTTDAYACINANTQASSQHQHMVLGSEAQAALYVVHGLDSKLPSARALQRPVSFTAPCTNEHPATLPDNSSRRQGLMKDTIRQLTTTSHL